MELHKTLFIIVVWGCIFISMMMYLISNSVLLFNIHMHIIMLVSAYYISTYYISVCV